MFVEKKLIRIKIWFEIIWHCLKMFDDEIVELISSTAENLARK